MTRDVHALIAAGPVSLSHFRVGRNNRGWLDLERAQQRAELLLVDPPAADGVGIDRLAHLGGACGAEWIRPTAPTTPRMPVASRIAFPIVVRIVVSL